MVTKISCHAGIMVSTVLFGINIVQTWIYVNTNEDKWPLRLFVTFLFGVDVAQTAICSKIVHHYFIENFGNPEVFAGISVPTDVEYALVVVIVFFVQLYFVGRVYKLHRNRIWLPVVIAIGAVGTFVSGIISIDNIVRGASDTSTLVNTHMRIAAGIDHGFATVTDIITTVALSWAVSTAHSGFRRTRALLQRLLLYIVTRGLLVTVVQVAFLIAYEAQPYGLSWAVLHFCLGKVYVVTMITMWGNAELLLPAMPLICFELQA
ncbi:hypothetical protein BDZ94DRAFT_921683 [Collybia nuda]|uniref:DUF6534 domain-containing protein n=1 Tax=Collybia nuda TaxID=64659 RepID=A0A9P5Y165_9AGAR|nr:hypothetical protein BDZ94DRAFT_921683 [Collybia nuda]